MLRLLLALIIVTHISDNLAIAIITLIHTATILWLISRRILRHICCHHTLTIVVILLHIWTVFRRICLIIISTDLDCLLRRLAFRQTFLFRGVPHKFLPLETRHFLLLRGLLLVFSLLILRRLLLRRIILLLLVYCRGGLVGLGGFDGQAEFVDVTRVVVFFVLRRFTDGVAAGAVLELLLGEDHVDILHGLRTS